MKIAILVDQLMAKGGAERVGLALARTFNADIWTTTFMPAETYQEFKSFRVYAHPSKSIELSAKFKPLSFLWQGLVQTENVYRFRRMALSDYDVIISSGMSAKHVAVRDKNHPCIHYEHGVKEHYRLEGLFKAWVCYIKRLDFEATMRVDKLVCNSQNTRQKIAEYYHRNAIVVYPPADIKRFHRGEAGDYFLSVQRISRDKRIETQLEAFRMAPEQKLLIVGSALKSDASYFEKLVGRAPKNVIFHGSATEDELVDLYSHSKAVIQSHPAEDFGIVPVEAMASGKPCIAVNAGGFRETIVHGKTGILVDGPFSENLAVAIRDFNCLDFNPGDCVEQAKLFSDEEFTNKMTQIVSGL